jgi:cellulose synthase/poly-beta-1,6-N-acetylglucosamine synthase-like glycosyltransferase
VYYFALTIVIFTGLPAVGASLYLLILTLLSGRPRVPSASNRQMRFDIIVPAHNEELVIEAVVRSLKAVDWPEDRFRVVVVADNCTDATATIAGAAGAHVMKRVDQEHRGKGYALDFAFKISRARGWADAVLVVDADAEVSSNILEACACRMERGEKAVQVHYGVSNTNASWRTRLLSIAKASFHIVRSRGRERLGVSCGIRGNGWSVTHDLLDQVPYKAFSLTEDLEYGIDLGAAGTRVAYADEAHSDAEMVSGEKDSRKQRQRWEQGRFQLIKSRTLPLLLQAVRQPSRVCLDLALDLMVLPVSYVYLNVGLLLVLSLWAASQYPTLVPWVWVSVACAFSLIIYVLRGWQLSGAGLRGLLDLGRAPFFLAWKLVVMLRGGSSKEWVRTKREGS